MAICRAAGIQPERSNRGNRQSIFILAGTIIQCLKKAFVSPHGVMERIGRRLEQSKKP